MQHSPLRLLMFPIIWQSIPREKGGDCSLVQKYARKSLYRPMGELFEGYWYWWYRVRILRLDCWKQAAPKSYWMHWDGSLAEISRRCQTKELDTRGTWWRSLGRRIPSSKSRAQPSSLKSRQHMSLVSRLTYDFECKLTLFRNNDDGSGSKVSTPRDRLEDDGTDVWRDWSTWKLCICARLPWRDSTVIKIWLCSSRRGQNR